ncbi:hypothetical protein FRC07_008259 [Ceratobasidium sp. 392]|nr:hypothetical protein FRC07_008259 [Ceratobasidium sp. 392]
MVLDVYFRNYRTFSRAKLEDFLDSIEELGQIAFTESEVLRLAMRHNMSSHERKFYWMGVDVPPFTVSQGDVGYVDNSSPGKSVWRATEAAEEFDSTQCRILCNDFAFGTRGWKPKIVMRGPWVRYELCPTLHLLKLTSS